MPVQSLTKVVTGKPVNTLASNGLDVAVGGETVVSVW